MILLTNFYAILLTNKMDSTRVDGNRNNNSKMKDEFDNYIDDKVCLYETVSCGQFIKEELCDIDNKEINIHNYVATKDENIKDGTVVAFINEKPSAMQYKQENIHNYINIKNENIDELITNYTDDKVCPNETVFCGGYIKQEPCDMKDEQENIQNYLGIKEDLTVVAQEIEVVTDYVDNKVCVHETIISRGYIKEEPCDRRDESGNTHNNVSMKGCSECGDKYDLYCLKCPMLIRIFDSINPNGTDNTLRGTLPKNFLDVCETLYGMGVVALRTIPKGVVFGPFKGLDSTKDEVISKWKLDNRKLDVTKDPQWLNWMQYIRRADKSFHQNLVPFQYKDGLYYRSECIINVGDELLVHWDSNDKESEIQDMEDWAPDVCENFDDSYACTFCCVGYKLISHLKAHNFTCIEKRNKKDFCKDIVQCDICKIYLDKKEYSDYHMDRCYKSDGKCVISSSHRRNPFEATANSILERHNDDRPFACTLCPFKTKTNWNLNRHNATHNDDRPFACTFCTYKTKTKGHLKQHVMVHNNSKPFACSHCSYKTQTKWSLKQHIRVHNNDKPFACSLCPYKTKKKSRLKEHSAHHSGDKPFACMLCPYKTVTNSVLKRHIATHNGHKPFACTLCPYKTKTKFNLKQHIASHNGDKPFACTLCSYKATTKSSLKQHIRIHTREKPFACSICPYETTTNSNLKRHIAVHSDDKAFACTLSPHNTTRKSCLNDTSPIMTAINHKI